MEVESVEKLQSLISRYAPHLNLSFINSSDWWKQHRHSREAHVSLANQATLT